MTLLRTGSVVEDRLAGLLSDGLERSAMSCQVLALFCLNSTSQAPYYNFKQPHFEWKLFLPEQGGYITSLEQPLHVTEVSQDLYEKSMSCWMKLIYLGLR